MTDPVLSAFPLAAVAVAAAHLGGGALLGLLYLQGLWWNAQLFARGGAAAAAVALMVGRFALLAGVLTLVGRLEGWPLLLATALGLLAARLVVMRRHIGAAA